MFYSGGVEARTVDDLVQKIYQDTKDDPSDPPWMGKFVTHYFRPWCHTLLEEPVGVFDLRGYVDRRDGGWMIHLPMRRPKGAFNRMAMIGYALARVVAHQSIERWTPDRWSDDRERVLVDAIVVPTPFIVRCASQSDDDIANHLMTHPSVVERRRRIVERASSPRLRVAPLAKVANVIDIAQRRRA